MRLTEKAEKFLSRKPLLVFAETRGGKTWSFYEHRIKGDEAPFVCITAEGKFRPTTYWNIEDIAHATYEELLSI